MLFGVFFLCFSDQAYSQMVTILFGGSVRGGEETGNDMTGERARVGQSPPPWRPGLPAVNRRFAVPSAYSFRLSGRASACIPAGHALSAHPCPSPLLS